MLARLAETGTFAEPTDKRSVAVSKGLSRRTLHVLACLSAALGWAVRRRYVASNLCASGPSETPTDSRTA
jgi:hypothetical protein